MSSSTSKSPAWLLTLEARNVECNVNHFQTHGRHAPQFIQEASLNIHGYQPILLQSQTEYLEISTGIDDTSNIERIKWQKTEKKEVKIRVEEMPEPSKSHMRIQVTVTHGYRRIFQPKPLHISEHHYVGVVRVTHGALDTIIQKVCHMRLSDVLIDCILEYASYTYEMTSQNVECAQDSVLLIDISSDEQTLEKRQMCTLDVSNWDSYANIVNAPSLKTCIADAQYLVIECQVLPEISRECKMAGMISHHGPGTGFELRVTCLRTSVGPSLRMRRQRQKTQKKERQCHVNFEFLYTTGWAGHWSHNEICVKTTQSMAEMTWIDVTAVYDKLRGFLCLKVGDWPCVSSRIQGDYRPCHKEFIQFGRNVAWNERKFFGKLRNVRIDTSI